MTNKMIVLMQSVELMEQGVLKGTGEFITMTDAEGTEKQFEVPEAIHTFQTWKALGYVVRKGEKAIAKFPIWKYVNGKKTDDEENESSEKVGSGKMFMKTSAWFSASQVEPIEA